MSVAESCTSTSLVIRPPSGLSKQLREAFPEAAPYRYAILDHDSKFDADVIAFLKATGLEPKRTSVQAPWQMGSQSAGWEAAAARCSTISSL